MRNKVHEGRNMNFPNQFSGSVANYGIYSYVSCEPSLVIQPLLTFLR